MIGSITGEKRLFSAVKIYYFSGTGNARAVACWFSKVAESLGIEQEIISIAKSDSILPEKAGPDVLIGFCSPTHGFNFPPVTLKFILKFPKGKNSVFILNTRAGMKLWKLHLPGLSGVAQLFAATVLKLKGYRIVGMRPVDLPSNWISLHPGLKSSVVDSIFAHCRRSIERFAQKLLSGGRDYRALFDSIQDMAISPVAVGYYFIGRYVLAKTFIASGACTLCRLCIKTCPVKAIREIDRRPYWTFKCESCMKCMNNCPERAIQTAHGLVIGTLYLFFTVGMEWLFFFTIDKIPEGTITAIAEQNMVKFTLASALSIPFLWIAYRLVHFLMRYRLFERMVTYTSLTVFKFWRRYKVPAKFATDC